MLALAAVQAAPVDDAQDRQAGKNKIGGKTGNIVYAGGNPIFNEFAPAVTPKAVKKQPPAPCVGCGGNTDLGEEPDLIVWAGSPPWIFNEFAPHKAVTPKANTKKVGGKTGNIVYAGGNPNFDESAPHKAVTPKAVKKQPISLPCVRCNTSTRGPSGKKQPPAPTPVTPKASRKKPFFKGAPYPVTPEPLMSIWWHDDQLFYAD